MPLSFLVRHWSEQEVKGRSPNRTWRGDRRQALTQAVILFIASAEDKSEPGQPRSVWRRFHTGVNVAAAVNRWPRATPQAEAHNGQHDWIGIRRGRSSTVPEDSHDLTRLVATAWPL